MDSLLYLVVQLFFELLLPWLWSSFWDRNERRQEATARRFTVSSAVERGPATRLGKDTQCLVCANPLEADVVSCPKCATPHHQDCWDYVRGCAV